MIETNVVVRLWQPQERPLTDKEMANGVLALWKELTPVTTEMLEAASRAHSKATTAPEIEMYGAIWRAMLKAKLGAPT